MHLPNSLGTFVATNLADNERGGLNWNHPEPPDASYQRIGCIGDGSCFFHAIARGMADIYQLSYQKNNIITEETIQKFENSIQRTNLFNPYIFNPPRFNRQAQYTIINQIDYERSMLTFRTVFVQDLRQQLARALQTDERWRNLVAERLWREIEVQRAIIIDQYAEFVENQITQSQMTGADINIIPLDDEKVNQHAFNLVINGLVRELNSSDAVDARYALLLSDYYNWDIYVIIDREMQNPNSKNALMSVYFNSAVLGPRNMRPHDNQTPSRPAIVINHVNGGHYEIIGKVDPINGIIETAFNSGDPLIRKLYGILLNIRVADQI